MTSFTSVKRVGELQALSGVVLTPRLRPDFVVSVSFLVKTERVDRLLLRSFSLKSLRVLAGDLSLHLFWSCSHMAQLPRRTRSGVFRGSNLFVSPSCSIRPIFENSVSLFP